VKDVRFTTGRQAHRAAHGKAGQPQALIFQIQILAQVNVAGRGSHLVTP